MQIRRTTSFPRAAAAPPATRAAPDYYLSPLQLRSPAPVARRTSAHLPFTPLLALARAGSAEPQLGYPATEPSQRWDPGRAAAPGSDLVAPASDPATLAASPLLISPRFAMDEITCLPLTGPQGGPPRLRGEAAISFLPHSRAASLHPARRETTNDGDGELSCVMAHGLPSPLVLATPPANMVGATPARPHQLQRGRLPSGVRFVGGVRPLQSACGSVACLFEVHTTSRVVR